MSELRRSRERGRGGVGLLAMQQSIRRFLNEDNNKLGEGLHTSALDSGR